MLECDPRYRSYSWRDLVKKPKLPNCHDEETEPQKGLAQDPTASKKQICYLLGVELGPPKKVPLERISSGNRAFADVIRLRSSYMDQGSTVMLT